VTGLKLALRDKVSMELSEMMFIQKGIILKDEKTLSEQKVVSGNTINLIQ